jgi:tripartite-type tricarboxylate transporter receptor subunit TctC
MPTFAVARRLSHLLLVGATLAVAPLGWAQAWPARQPIRLVAVFPPGGSVDQVARILGPALQQQLGQSVIVGNKGGASGSVGTGAVQAFIDNQIDVWAKVVKANNIKAD